jgi:hypothetical protein
MFVFNPEPLARVPHVLPALASLLRDPSAEGRPSAVFDGMRLTDRALCWLLANPHTPPSNATATPMRSTMTSFESTSTSSAASAASQRRPETSNSRLSNARSRCSEANRLQVSTPCRWRANSAG